MITRTQYGTLEQNGETATSQAGRSVACVMREGGRKRMRWDQAIVKHCSGTRNCHPFLSCVLIKEQETHFEKFSTHLPPSCVFKQLLELHNSEVRKNEKREREKREEMTYNAKLTHSLN